MLRKDTLRRSEEVAFRQRHVCASLAGSGAEGDRLATHRSASGGETRWARGQAAVGPALEEDSEEARMTAGMQLLHSEWINSKAHGELYSISCDKP